MRYCLLTFIVLIHPLFAHIYPFETPIEKYLKPCKLSYDHSGLTGIDALYVINLDERYAKWTRAEDLLIENGLKPNRFSAINGWNLSDEIKKELIGSYTKQFSGGRLGCLLSHVSVIKDAYERGFETIWIMEDDIVIVEDVRQVSELIDRLTRYDPDWDVFYTDIDSKNSEGKRIRSLASNFRPDQDYLPLSHYTERAHLDYDLMQIRQRFGLYSYILSRKGMEKILHFFTHVYIWTAVDIDIHYIPGIRQYQTTRDIVSIWYGSKISDTSLPLHALVVDHLIKPSSCRSTVPHIAEPR